MSDSGAEFIANPNSKPSVKSGLYTLNSKTNPAPKTFEANFPELGQIKPVGTAFTKPKLAWNTVLTQTKSAVETLNDNQNKSNKLHVVELKEPINADDDVTGIIPKVGSYLNAVSERQKINKNELKDHLFGPPTPEESDEEEEEDEDHYESNSEEEEEYVEED